MNDQNDTTRGRVDGLLRQWGAAEEARQAADQLAEPAAPKRIVRPGRRGNILLRWAPAGIAALLLLAAGVLFMSARMQPQSSVALGRDDRNASKSPQTQPADLSGELAIARQEAIEARRGAAEARTALSEVLVQKQGDDLQIKELAAQLKKQGDQAAKDREDWELTDARLTSLLSKAEQSARDARGELEKVRKDLVLARAAASKTPKESEELEKLKVRLTIAVKELKRQQDTFRAANAERDKTKRALASLKARNQNTVDQVRRVYLAAAAPGKTGLAALQDAIKRRGLLKQCALLQRKARAESDKKLLARTEVVLMRLGLLDLSDSTAVSAYMVQLAKSDLIASLDTATAAFTVDAAAQDWLFETKLILMGVQRVT
jgi:hypothetical protein